MEGLKPAVPELPTVILSVALMSKFSGCAAALQTAVANTHDTDACRRETKIEFAPATWHNTSGAT
jgi:hypothetical protein